MFSKVADPTMDIYDFDTNKYIGKARFTLTPEVEKALLDLVNHGTQPDTLVLSYFDLFEPASDYVLPAPDQDVRRMGFMRAYFTESVSGKSVPIEIQFIYDLVIRSLFYANRYIGCAQLNNIDVLKVRQAD